MTEVSASAGARRQLLLFGGLFTVVAGLLALGYFLFLRTEYVVLAQGLRAADASAVVAELDKAGKDYRLRDGGATILVPEAEADATRVAIAGSEAGARGQIGFELFNKSDMGLTNFAQKINFQRALQGELVRTIMMMDGVESARVHLALPERTLFRGDRAEPKAAVTIAMKPGQTADPARVAGIQRLVASAVPDLPETKVVVLDSNGRTISPVVAIEAPGERPAELEERAAVESYYQARTRGAIERRLPGLKFAVRVLALPLAEARPDGAETGWTPTGEGAARNFRLRLIVVTEAALGPEDRELAQEAAVEAAGLGLQRGDSLAFETGPVDPVPAALSVPAEPAAAVPEAQPAPAMPTPVSYGGWAWVLGVGVALVLLFLGARRLMATRLANEDHEAFAAQLRRQLSLAGGDGDAVA